MARKIKNPIKNGKYTSRVYFYAFSKPSRFTDIGRLIDGISEGESLKNSTSTGITRAIEILIPKYLDEIEGKYFSKAEPFADQIVEDIRELGEELTTREYESLLIFLDGKFRNILLHYRHRIYGSDAYTDSVELLGSIASKYLGFNKGMKELNGEGSEVIRFSFSSHMKTLSPELLKKIRLFAPKIISEYEEDIGVLLIRMQEFQHMSNKLKRILHDGPLKMKKGANAVDDMLIILKKNVDFLQICMTPDVIDSMIKNFEVELEKLSETGQYKKTDPTKVIDACQTFLQYIESGEASRHMDEILDEIFSDDMEKFDQVLKKLEEIRNQRL